MRQTITADGNGSGGEAEAFDYPACPGAPPLPAWDGWAEAGESLSPDAMRDHAKGASGGASHLNSAAHLKSDQQLRDEARKSFAAGYERGRKEGIEAERDAQAATAVAEAERHKMQILELAQSFARERDSFLHKVEQEVVKLALAVAARILRREAQMDPLLLAGAVRVALGQLAQSSKVRLKVPAAEVELWTETMALVPNLKLKPVIVAGEGMRLGDCVVESEVGTVDLGIRSQLGEIERGFFDRAASTSFRASTDSREVAAAQDIAAAEEPA